MDQADRGGAMTPLGSIWVEVAEGAVVRLGWGAVPDRAAVGLLRDALDELGAYFAGRLQVFSVPVRPDASGLTARALAAMQAIPFGQTRTYGDLAHELSGPAQAIGQACGANPIPILIPCHRVLGASGLGGYSGAGGVETKVALLKHEGAASLLI